MLELEAEVTESLSNEQTPLIDKHERSPED